MSGTTSVRRAQYSSWWYVLRRLTLNVCVRVNFPGPLDFTWTRGSGSTTGPCPDVRGSSVLLEKKWVSSVSEQFGPVYHYRKGLNPQVLIMDKDQKDGSSTRKIKWECWTGRTPFMKKIRQVGLSTKKFTLKLISLVHRTNRTL